MEGVSMQELKDAGVPSSSSGAGTNQAQVENANVGNWTRTQGSDGAGEGEEEDVDVGLAERTLVDDPTTTTTTRAHTHVKGPSSSSISLPVGPDEGAGEGPSRTFVYQPMHVPQKSVDRADGHSQRQSEDQPRTATTAVTWDPLKANGTDDGHDGEKTHRRRATQDDTVVVEDEGEDVVDSKGKLLFAEDDDEEKREGGVGVGGIAPASAIARRASHLRLDLKPTPSSPLPWEQIDPPPDNNSKSIAGYYSPAASQKFRTLQSSGGGPRSLIPKSSYYFGPPAPDSAYGTAPVGQIGVHHPREILRVERDYTGGEVIQFAPIYPLELEGRITPTHFLESINAINELLISAHSLRHSLVDNMLAIFSLQISKLFVKSHFEKVGVSFIYV
ncbi:hypothetical protein JR316_0001241 [Psilocybe cubensis]|uniref:Uncharacterized protein n=2 Tax=Psilocybe cubensis TaxID=181762 RepID=A0ACB8HHI8_PSICU|nr:hypothetical protein JR316_0001241 [Psilocybe cubensis]KAH9487172.1 hypothetical protein JR316_0001241 [Psilocybe cubensis]